VARKLKTYQTSAGFYDLAIAAPSMKAALEAWGSNSNLFHQGFASEATDPRIIAAAMEMPGVVLKRPVGSCGPFTDHAKLPTDLSGHHRRRSQPAKKQGRSSSSKIDDKIARKAATAFQQEQRRRETKQRREDEAEAKKRERRQRVVAQAESALEGARLKHEARLSVIEKERAKLEKRFEQEEGRWDELRNRLESDLRRARR
jgi:colicin import membrane protein